MWLHDSSSELESDDDGGDGYFSYISQSCLSAGTYYVKIDSFAHRDTISSYELSLDTTNCSSSSEDSDLPSASHDAGNTISQAVTLNRNSSRTDNITPASDIDWFQFTLNAPSAIELETSGSSGDDTRMWLHDSSSELESNDDGGDGYFSYISQSCLSAGTYYVKIDSFANSSIIPNYTLSLNTTSCSSPNSSSETTNSSTIRFYTDSPPSCGEANNIQLSMIPANGNHTTLFVYIEKCNGDPFGSSGRYYVTVNGTRIFGPYDYYEGDLYASEIIEPPQEHTAYIGFNDFQIELYPNEQYYPIRTGIVAVEGREE